MTLTIIALCFAVLLVLSQAYVMWCRHEEAKAAARHKFNRIAQANSEAKPWNPPPRGPKGGDWRNRRKAA